MSLEQLLAWIPPGSPDETLARQVNFEQLPSHVAIIMDGNGRWAAQRHLPRVEGHRAGIDSVRDVVETSARLGFDVLTLYAFSVENWKRPRTEINTLMTLLKRYLRLELATLLKNNIRFHVIGRQDELSRRRAARARARRRSKLRRTPGCWFNIALNYGGRTEIVDAARRADCRRRPGRRTRRAPLREIPVHRGPAGSRPADSDERRNARQQLPPVADRLRGDLGHRNPVARLPPPAPARGRARVSEARPPLRRHQTFAGRAGARSERIANRQSTSRQPPAISRRDDPRPQRRRAHRCRRRLSCGWRRPGCSSRRRSSCLLLAFVEYARLSEALRFSAAARFQQAWPRC